MALGHSIVQQLKYIKIIALIFQVSLYILYLHQCYTHSTCKPHYCNNTIYINIILYTSYSAFIHINYIMHSQQNVFTTSFFLSNTNKGFTLHKLKKNSIPSNYSYKIKSKSNYNNHQNRTNQTTLPYFNNTNRSNKQDYISDHLLRDAKQKLYEKKKYTNIINNHGHLDSLQREDSIRNHQSFSHEQSRTEDMNYFINNNIDRYRNRVNSITLQPAFPQIDKGKRKQSKLTSKSFRNIQDRYLQVQQYTNKKDKQSPEKNAFVSKTIDINKQPVVNHTSINSQLQCLIAKQVMKTQNQCILRQGLIKFDETKANISPDKNKKQYRSNNIGRKKKKKAQHHITVQSNQVNTNINPSKQCISTQNVLILSGPSVQKLNKTRYIQSQTMYPKQHKSVNINRFNSTMMKIKQHAKKPSQKQSLFGVKGWENQNISQSSQNFDRQQEVTNYQQIQTINRVKVQFIKSDKIQFQ